MPGTESFIFIFAVAQGPFVHDRAALEVHQGFFGSVDGNAIQPRIKLCLAAELVQCPIRSNERLLRNVLNKIGIAHHAANQALDAALVFDDQQLVSPLITGHSTLDQLKIAIGWGNIDGRGNGHE